MLLIRCQNCDRLPRDDQFFVRGDDPDLGAALDGADLGFSAAYVVLLRIEPDAGEVEVAADRLAEGRAVLADATSEREDVAATQRDQVAADEAADALDERVDRQLGPRASTRGCYFDVAHVGGNAAHSEE